MSEKEYQWKRFWVPPSGAISLGDSGFLVDPDTEAGRVFSPGVVPFERIEATPCLVLLGEPGMGKSKAMKMEDAALAERIRASGAALHRLDLKTYGSEDHLLKKLIEAPVFKEWEKGQHVLHLFLDSLDECLLRIENVAQLLIDELRTRPVERLMLRIACRTAEWPMLLQEELPRLWPAEQVAYYELAPLRRKDVAEAAATEGLDAQRFIQEVLLRGAAPLAIKPITLRFLINMFRRDHALPQTQVELYRRGCRALCEEPSRSRQAAHRIGNLDPDRRFAIASRIAAVTVFGRKAAIWIDNEQGQTNSGDVTLGELSGGKETVDGNSFDVDIPAVREVLSDTALFSSRGTGRLGWAHQTYAEFLAAEFVTRRQMPLMQTVSLLMHADDAAKVVPQLHEAAAWLASMNTEFFAHVMVGGPELLLRSDVATADPSARAAVVQSLLSLLDEEKLFDVGWSFQGNLKRLDHPGLTDQLRPWIADTGRNWMARRVAVEIAQACGIGALAPELLTVALDQTELTQLRSAAAGAVAAIADDSALRQLRPLAEGRAGDDPDDELKGIALRALWPRVIDSEVLFSLITKPKRQNYSGIYVHFIEFELAEELQPSDLPAALKWIERQPSRYGREGRTFDEAVARIMRAAWENLDAPDVSEPFARAALSRMRLYEKIFEHLLGKPPTDPLAQDESRRRKLVSLLLQVSTDKEKKLERLVYGQETLVKFSDLEWLIAQLRREPESERRTEWASLIRVVCWQELGREPIDAAIAATEWSPELAKELAPLVNPMEIGSPDAEKIKAHEKRIREMVEQRDEAKLLDPPPKERVRNRLDLFWQGQTEQWWMLNRELTLEPHSTHYGDDFELDLTALPGWKDADQETTDRLLDAARQYLLDADPSTSEWLGQDIFHYPSVAGYRALALLEKLAPDVLHTISAEVWKKWAPVVLAHQPRESRQGKKDSALIEMAYRSAPTEMLAALAPLIDRENRFGHVLIIQSLHTSWDERLAAFLVEKVRDPLLQPSSTRYLLDDLLERKVPAARAFAETLLTLPVPVADPDRARAREAAHSLLLHSPDAAWAVVWAAVIQSPTFGEELFLDVATDPFERHQLRLAERLSEDQLMALFLWLEKHFPKAEDPNPDGAHFVTKRESLGHFRDRLINHLQSRGTRAACDALERIATELPKQKWLLWQLSEARRLTLQKTWSPASPKDILALGDNSGRRLVNTEVQLLALVLESLQRLQDKLQGETPSAQFLWDKQGEKAWRPKDEEAVCHGRGT